MAENYFETKNCTCGGCGVIYEWDSKEKKNLISMEVQRGITQKQDADGELWPGYKELCDKCQEILKESREMRAKWLS